MKHPPKGSAKHSLQRQFLSPFPQEHKTKWKWKACKEKNNNIYAEVWYLIDRDYRKCDILLKFGPLKQTDKVSLSDCLWKCVLSTARVSKHPSQVCVEGSLRRQIVSIKAMGGSCENLIQADKERRVGEKILGLSSPVLPHSLSLYLAVVNLLKICGQKFSATQVDGPTTNPQTHNRAGTIVTQAGGQQKSRTEQFSRGIMR